MSMWNFSSLRLHRKIKSKASHKFHSPIKIHHTYMYIYDWLVGKTRTKISLSDPGKSLTTMCLLSLRRLRRFNGNYQLYQSSQFFFEMTREIRMVTWKQGLKLTCPKGKSPGRPSSNKIIN